MWVARNGDRCAVPPDQIVQSRYMRMDYGMRIITDKRAMNGQRFNSQRSRKERRRKKVTFAEAIGHA